MICFLFAHSSVISFYAMLYAFDFIGLFNAMNFWVKANSKTTTTKHFMGNLHELSNVHLFLTDFSVHGTIAKSIFLKYFASKCLKQLQSSRLNRLEHKECWIQDVFRDVEILLFETL